MGGFSFFSDLINPTKYNIPDWQDVNAGQIQQQTVSDNLATFQGAKSLATDYNDYMQNQVAAALKKAIPEFDVLQNQMAKNISAKLTGQLTDAQKKAFEGESWRASNAAARRLGIAGSPAAFNMGTRDLGLKYGQQEAQGEAAWAPFVSTVASLKRAPMFDFSSVFMTPQQRVNVALQNQENRWNVANLKAQQEAQPAPWMKALAGLGDTAATFGAAYGVMNAFQPKKPEFTIRDYLMANQTL